MEAVEKVARWKQSPRAYESNNRFYEFDGFSDLLASDVNIIVGRKGAGKTAIARHIARGDGDIQISRILNFTDFPFNKLEYYGRTDVLNSSKYVEFWTYLTLVAICELVAKDRSSYISEQDVILRAFEDDPRYAFSDKAQAHADRSFSLNVLGSGISLGEAKAKDRTFTLSEKCHTLQKIISTARSSKTIYVMFDELDEGQSSVFDSNKNNEYANMISSLIKSCIDIAEMFNNINIRPIIFIRQDIYDFLDAPNRNKWEDFTARLDWSEVELEKLILHRIGQEVVSEDHKSTIGKEAIAELLFENYYYYRIHKSQTLRDPVIQFMSRSTLLRPRDIIVFVRESAKSAVARGEQRIQKEDIRFGEGKFSNFLYQEMMDELKYLIPNLEELMNAVRRMERRHFSWTDLFAELPEELISKWDKYGMNLTKVLTTLYRYGYVGNVNMQSSLVFNHQGQQLDFDRQMGICLHRGLQYKLGFSGRKENYNF